MRSINSKTPLFTNPLTEPLFYTRYIRRWVQESSTETDVLSQLHKAALKNAL